ncbi:MAG: hypothetical protein QNJ17_01700 [Desulfocapsaceae bacterium]|nr:hypothetical protein [Desulfocapsaceae bacterium]
MNIKEKTAGEHTVAGVKDVYKDFFHTGKGGSKFLISNETS